MISLEEIELNKIDRDFLKNSCFDNYWLNLVLNSYNLKLKNLKIKNKDIYVIEQKIFFKKFLISLPMIYDLKIESELFDCIFENKKEINYFFIKNNIYDLIIKSDYKHNHQYPEYFKTHWLDFFINLEDDLNKIQSGFRYDLRRLLKNTHNKYEVQYVNKKDDIINYFVNYSEFYKKKGYFCYTKNFFSNIDKTINHEDAFIIMNIKDKSSNQIFGGIFFYMNKLNNKAIYLNSWMDLKVNFPTVKVLLFEMIKFLKKKNFRQLFLGRNEPNNKGLTFFKSSFNSNLQKLNYFSFRKKNYQILENKILSFLIRFFIRNIPMKAYLIINSLISKQLLKF